MSRGYKRRQKGLKRGTWENANEKSARIWSEFADSVDAEIRRLEAMPPEQLEAIRQEYNKTRGTP
jgi:hypothetical protein